jgi:hypothetical protein
MSRSSPLPPGKNGKKRPNAGSRRPAAKVPCTKTPPHHSASSADILERAAQLSYTAIVREILAGTVVVYPSVNGRPFLFSKIRGLKPLNHDLASLDAEEWVMQLAHQRFACLLRNAHARRICSALAGREPQPRPEEVHDAGEIKNKNNEAFVALIVSFAAKQGTSQYRAHAANMLAALAKHAADTKEPALKGCVPHGASTLSRMLNEYSPRLLAAGIKFERERSNGGRMTLTRLVDDDSNVPPKEAETTQTGVPSKPPSDAPGANSAQKSESAASLDAIRHARELRIGKRVPE